MTEFFHFTHIGHLPSIMAQRRLLPTESNVGAPYPVNDGPMGTRIGPDVVWLLDTDVADGDASEDDTTHGLYPDKRRVRFTVDVAAVRWVDWAPAKIMSPDWRERMVAAAGGAERAEHWYVWPAPIRDRRWLSVHDMLTDTAIAYDDPERPDLHEMLGVGE